MTHFSSRSPRKIVLPILIITFILVAFNLPVIFKSTFLHIKGVIEKSASQALDKEVTIERIGFLPYGELILHDLKIQDRQTGLYYADVTSCHIKFKIWPLVLKRTVVITQVTFKEPLLLPGFRDLKIPEEKKKDVGEYKLEVSEYFLIKAASGRARFSGAGSAPNEIGFTFWARTAGGDRFFSEGSVDLKSCYLEDYLLNDLFFFEFIDKVSYRLKASVNEGELSIDKALLDFGQFKIGASGVIENYKTNPTVNLELSLKDLSFSEKMYLNSRLLATSIRNLIVHVSGAFKESRWSVSLDELRSRFSYLPTVLRVDNFYCNLNMSKEGLVIEDCSCFFNNFPVGLRCTLSGLRSPHIDLKVISHPGQIASLRPFNPLNFEFSFSGDKQGDSLRGRMFFQIRKAIPSKSEEAHELSLVVGDLLCRFSKDIISSADKNTAPLLLEARDVVCRTNAPRPEMNFEFADFKTALYPKDSKMYFSDIKTSGYEGFLRGQGFLDFKGPSPQVFFDFGFNGLSMSELMDVFHLDYDLEGALSGEGVFNTETTFSLSGTATVSDGYVKNLKLLNLIADFLGVDSLRDIYFESCSSNFSLSADGKEMLLDSIRLRGEDVYLDASLGLKNKEKVRGDMLVRLSTDMLKESFKLRMLFFLVGERLPYADFEFKIGGFLGSPHIKWMDTKFRKHVMRYLSEKGQKGMERKLEETIRFLSEEE